MVDTEIKLNEMDAHDFADIMRSVDSEMIRARDEFISGISCHSDEQGTLSIDISDIASSLEV